MRELRTCARCDVSKPLELMVFNKTLGSYQNLCKGCKRVYDREYRERNRERLNAYDKERHAANPEYRRSQARQWAKDNKERHNENTKRWSDANRDKQHAAEKAWRQKHPHKQREKNHRRKARLYEGGGTYDHSSWLMLLERCGNQCLRCGSRDNITIDHVVPLARGGANLISNLQPLCKPCNSGKGAKTVDYRSVENKAYAAFLQSIEAALSEDSNKTSDVDSTDSPSGAGEAHHSA
jgi:5-methylcytosine-specific restriction endonuclease McrA